MDRTEIEKERRVGVGRKEIKRIKLQGTGGRRTRKGRKRIKQSKKTVRRGQRKTEWD